MIGVVSGWFEGVDDNAIEQLSKVAARIPTKAADCRCTGKGLCEATTRELGTFMIEARDAQGSLLPEGGDAFSVAIRGRGERVRAKIIDNGDGRYAVGYKPVTSGKYFISVSLQGESLPGSPFLCLVSSRTPSAPHCVVRGRALVLATARKEESFELEFRVRAAAPSLISNLSSDTPCATRARVVPRTRLGRSRMQRSSMSSSRNVMRSWPRQSRPPLPPPPPTRRSRRR